jgi:molybdopterin-containing oxidoreductase family iron-sulfur binding subunit
MAPNRREFLLIAGLTAIGVACPSLARVLYAKAGATAPNVAVEAVSGITPALKAKRWAMAVSPGKCPSDCRACIDACHLTHNVPDFGNPKDEIQWIGLQPFERVFPGETYPQMPEAARARKLPVLCNHCDNPPCVRVCPTQATFKRADGIVMMDYHRCIGCRFCMAACPYGARSMNYRDPRPFIRKINNDYPTRTKGVVEKCTFCEERLRKGMLPACVVACEEKALVFGDIDDPRSEIRRLLDKELPIRRRVDLGTKPQAYYIL